MATTEELNDSLHANRLMPSTTTSNLELRNRAGDSSSPYVQGHKNNPVAWQNWNPETLELAKQHNRLIFVSIGYAACHWCHVMERESFMSQEVADILNKNFIPIKIDREERPDIDAIYMNYVQASTGGGGWPLNVFITPDLEPVFGGTYFPGPGSSNMGQVPFIDLLERLRDTWKTQEDRCRSSAKEITAKLREFAQEGIHAHEHEPDSGRIDLELLDDAYRLMAHQYDSKHGGFSKAPKFPTPTRLQYLLQLSQWPAPVADVVGKEECTKAAAMATETLINMSRGGLRDQIGFGFARYSVTKDWSLPHFEKMLYDQGLLLDVYLNAYLMSNQSELLGAIYDIATYLTQEPIYRSSTGGFNSSEDADSKHSHNDTEAHEGAFYVWTHAEILSVLGNEQEASIVTKFYNIKPHGNIAPENDPHDELHNKNVLSISDTPKRIAKHFGLKETEVYSILKSARIKLREHRDKTRPRPALDDKIVVSWNGFAIASLARASGALVAADPLSAGIWLSAAIKTATFIKNELWNEGTKTLYRVYREKRSDIKALADDYAALISGCIELYNTTFNTTWLQWADTLQRRQNELFSAENGMGFYTTEAPSNTSTNDLLLRLKQGMDSAEPSANSISALNLFKLGALLEDEAYTELGRKTVAAFETEIEQYPASFPGLLGAGIWSVLGGKAVLVVGDDLEGETQGKLMLRDVLLRLRRTTGIGRTVLRISQQDLAGLEWLQSRNPIVRELKIKPEDGIKVMLCEAGACRDITNLEEL